MAKVRRTLLHKLNTVKAKALRFLLYILLLASALHLLAMVC
jgi:hypothetical protein